MRIPSACFALVAIFCSIGVSGPEASASPVCAKRSSWRFAPADIWMGAAQSRLLAAAAPSGAPDLRIHIGPTLT